MDFVDQLKQFAKRVESMKDSLQTEEATKTALIMPFFSMLGYDVFNPQEFVPEFTADVGIKKGGLCHLERWRACDLGGVQVYHGKSGSARLPALPLLRDNNRKVCHFDKWAVLQVLY